MSLPPSKMPFDLSKERWHPSPLPGHIIIVSTIDAEGRPNIAPKSWFTMASFRGPHVAFGCSLDHRTYQNAAASGEFVVNIVSHAWATRMAACAAPGITTSRASGMVARNVSSVCGRASSNSPAMNSVGAAIDGRSAARVQFLSEPLLRNSVGPHI